MTYFRYGKYYVYHWYLVYVIRHHWLLYRLEHNINKKLIIINSPWDGSKDGSEKSQQCGAQWTKRFPMMALLLKSSLTQSSDLKCVKVLHCVGSNYFTILNPLTPAKGCQKLLPDLYVTGYSQCFVVCHPQTKTR